MKECHNFLHPFSVEAVIYHSPCDDGHACAAQFLHMGKPLPMLGMHPKDGVNDELLAFVKDKNVVFVDICFSSNDMTRVAQCAKKVLVLDHHETNEKAMSQFVVNNLHGYFDMNKAGTELTWDYLNFYNKEIPKALKYIALKDTWKHKDNMDAVYFTTAFERPVTWKDWYPYIRGDEQKLQQVIEKGKVVYNYNQSILNTLIQKVAYVTWKNYKVAIVNVPYPFISDLGAMICDQKDATNTCCSHLEQTSRSRRQCFITFS